MANGDLGRGDYVPTAKLSRTPAKSLYSNSTRGNNAGNIFGGAPLAETADNIFTRLQTKAESDARGDFQLDLLGKTPEEIIAMRSNNPEQYTNKYLGSEELANQFGGALRKAVTLESQGRERRDQRITDARNTLLARGIDAKSLAEFDAKNQLYGAAGVEQASTSRKAYETEFLNDQYGKEFFQNTLKTATEANRLKSQGVLQNFGTNTEGTFGTREENVTDAEGNITSQTVPNTFNDMVILGKNNRPEMTDAAKLLPKDQQDSLREQMGYVEAALGKRDETGVLDPDSQERMRQTLTKDIGKQYPHLSDEEVATHVARLQQRGKKYVGLSTDESAKVATAMAPTQAAFVQQDSQLTAELNSLKGSLAPDKPQSAVEKAASEKALFEYASSKVNDKGPKVREVLQALLDGGMDARRLEAIVAANADEGDDGWLPTWDWDAEVDAGDVAASAQRLKAQFGTVDQINESIRTRLLAKESAYSNWRNGQELNIQREERALKQELFATREGADSILAEATPFALNTVDDQSKGETTRPEAQLTAAIAANNGTKLKAAAEEATRLAKEAEEAAAIKKAADDEAERIASLPQTPLSTEETNPFINPASVAAAPAPQAGDRVAPFDVAEMLKGLVRRNVEDPYRIEASNNASSQINQLVNANRVGNELNRRPNRDIPDFRRTVTEEEAALANSPSVQEAAAAIQAGVTPPSANETEALREGSTNANPITSAAIASIDTTNPITITGNNDVPSFKNPADAMAYSAKYTASQEGFKEEDDGALDIGDPGTSDAPTIGYGFRYKEAEGKKTMIAALGESTYNIINSSKKINKGQADKVMAQYMKEGEDHLKQLHPNWSSLPEGIKIAARDFMFNKGNTKYSEDTSFIDLVNNGSSNPDEVFNQTKRRSRSNQQLASL